MNGGLCLLRSARICPVLVALAALVSILLCENALAQTSSSGALTGTVLDPNGTALSGVVVGIVNKTTGAIASAISDSEGWFIFPLLAPGNYDVTIEKKDRESLTGHATVEINVTEVAHVEVHLSPAVVFQTVNVSAQAIAVQVDTSALGKVVDRASVNSLPLVTRNYAQIAGLAPGVATGVFNAGELGLGGTALSQIAKSNDGIYVHGARSYDNNFLMDGISVSDVQGSAAGSGGIPIPNPDSIEEFKVQTALYDAGYGRYAGANVSVITRTGSNTIHGTVFEFLRNEILNANDFFLNRANQPRPPLKQNQFGFALGGPIKKDKLLWFGSYQGTRQVNGIAAGQSRIACTASLIEPPLTNDRSAAELGKLFGGMSGAQGGIAVKADGSNINSSALALLSFRLPDGSFLIPTPQTIDPSKPFAQQGFSVFTDACHFNEDQVSANLDYVPRPKSKISARLFLADDDQTVTFPGNGLNPSGNIRGFPSPNDSGFRVFSLAHSYAFRNSWLNEARIGFVRTRSATEANAPFKWSDIGVAEGELSHNNELPSLNILGSASIASGFPRTIAQNSFVFTDNVSFIRGPHTVRMGGSLTRLQDNVNLVGLGSFLQFLSWPDFLLGLSAAGNQTNFSNVFASFDDFGLTNREFRVWEGSAFIQDDLRLSKTFTLNLGARYERLGQFGDKLGRNASFDINKADYNPPQAGSQAGYVIASNFSGTLPPGVARSSNQFGNDGAGQNTLAPRIGFSWQPWPKTSRVAVRGGYGIYYSRATGQAFYQNILGAPFSEFRLNAGGANANATFQTPFPQPFPTADSFPLFPVYSPTTATTVYSVSPRFRPAMIQQYSLNIQAEIHRGWLAEVGYVGTRGTHLVRQRSLNQALSASPNNAIRGVTTNTLASIPMRVPILGIPPDSLVEMESEGSSWYNALEASITKRLGNGFELLTSYTFSKTLDTDGADINATSSGNGLTLGDQNSPRERWGRTSFDRTHRFVFGGVWNLPGPPQGIKRTFLGGWIVSGIVTVQSGDALTIADTNTDNVFGISEDRAELSGRCSKAQLVNRGSLESRLNQYFNTSCFTTPPVIGADGIGTGFGNSPTGLVDGPGQANLDLSVTKSVALNWPNENSHLQIRVEFYNALNHPQFSDPTSNFSSATFGVIASTAVNPRVGQFALKLAF